MTTLKELPIGKTATVERVGGDGALRQHFLDMGLIPQADVTMVKHAPMGDPVEVRVHGYELTLRLDDAARIEVSDVRDAGEERKARRASAPLSHPGLGEGGARFHDKATETPLPDGTTITFALAGNQNCGKTTLFNQLTGSQPACGQLPRRHGGPQGRPHQEHSDSARGSRPAGHLFHLALHQRGDRHACDYLLERASRTASSTSWTPPTSSATCT